MGAERVEAILQRMRGRGERITLARRALVAALDQADDHRSADQLAAELRSTNPDIHRATVYRTLETLRRIGVVEHTHLGHGPAVYHLSDEVHQHLVCERCRTVAEVPPRLFQALEKELKRDYGFTMRSHHFAVVGLCHQCSDDGSVVAPQDGQKPEDFHV